MPHFYCPRPSCECYLAPVQCDVPDGFSMLCGECDGEMKGPCNACRCGVLVCVSESDTCTYCREVQHA